MAPMDRPFIGMKCSAPDYEVLLRLRLRYPQLGDSDLLRWGLHTLAHLSEPPFPAPLPPKRERYERKRAAEIRAALARSGEFSQIGGGDDPA